ncbi:Tol-Pal system beta propeller repeat protein TolB [Caulobacter sp. 17J65-9]|uniref:Tol-Pal system beta propeller repeat protein TolB n=1 Tax=Caulobacter sp. 17J65-9 TaxID=2709382 RepID=UPI0013CA1694|nr:Tol-Pal system beta propeller repeat protein TolB [Caulobacter sp. 17J65-9]NEX91646.1 Tol-Pal system protein TolB [Caulobacter sp. 17J65-9]
MRLPRPLVALFATLAVFGTFAPATAWAQIEVDVTQGVIKPVPIAIPAFQGQYGAEIAKVVSDDLERSGYFRPIDPNAFIERNLDISVQPRFADWRVINAEFLVNGRSVVDADGRLRVDFRLWNVAGEKGVDLAGKPGQEPTGLQFTSTPENWRKIAHMISDRLYEQMTGAGGYFNTRVVFVAESGPKTKRRKVLGIMDQDGANPQYLTDGTYQVMTPRFSSSDQKITYMALGDNFTRIYLFDIETGRQESLGQFEGAVFAPRFSPDGSKVAFSIERAGNSDIWTMDLRTRARSRLTADPAIDTSPSYSPDGRSIVFNSDRGGSPQLYVMGADGSGARRISYGNGRYSTPVWSPKGDWIAFTKQEGGRFHIGVMKPDGSDERILTSSYFEEGPTWAPNGRYIMFHREAPGVPPRLWIVDVTGRIERQAPYSGSASDPAWSPLLD